MAWRRINRRPLPCFIQSKLRSDRRPEFGVSLFSSTLYCLSSAAFKATPFHCNGKPVTTECLTPPTLSAAVPQQVYRNGLSGLDLHAVAMLQVLFKSLLLSSSSNNARDIISNHRIKLRILLTIKHHPITSKIMTNDYQAVSRPR